MFAAWTVARLACLGLPAALLIGLDGLVRILLKCIEDVLMARLASLRADVFRRLIVRGRRSRRTRFFLSAPESGNQKNQPDDRRKARPRGGARLARHGTGCMGLR